MLFDYEHLPFKGYKGGHKKVKVSGGEFGREYDAFFPEEHSVLDGIVFETKDVNDMRHMGGAIPQYYTKCFILKKGRDKWEKYFEGPARKFSIGDIEGNIDCGLFRILVQFESDEVKGKIVKKNQIKKLQGRIKENSLQLRGDVKMLRELF